MLIVGVGWVENIRNFDLLQPPSNPNILVFLQKLFLYRFSTIKFDTNYALHDSCYYFQTNVEILRKVPKKNFKKIPVSWSGDNCNVITHPVSWKIDPQIMFVRQNLKFWSKGLTHPPPPNQNPRGWNEFGFGQNLTLGSWLQACQTASFCRLLVSSHAFGCRLHYEHFDMWKLNNHRICEYGDECLNTEYGRT